MGRIVGITFPKKDEVYVCPVCGKEYKSQQALDKHIEKEHSSDESEDE